MGRHPSREDLLRIHVRLGGTPDDAAIENLDRILAAVHWAGPAIHDKAAVLLCGIARERPFADLNQESALHAVGFFYEINGWELRGDRPDSLSRLVADAAMGLPPAEVGVVLAGLAVLLD